MKIARDLSKCASMNKGKKRLTNLLTLAAVLSLLAVGCKSNYQKGYDKGYKKGYSEGREDGYEKGKSIGALETTARYEASGGLAGAAVGFALGAGLALLFTRRYVASEYRKFRRRRKVSTLLSRCEVDLDEDLYKRLVKLGERKQKLQEDMERDKGTLVEAAYGRVHSRLKRMDDRMVRLAGLLQQLRNIGDEVPLNENAIQRGIAKLEARREEAVNPKEKEEIAEAVEMEKRRLNAALKNKENIRRCDLKLNMLDSFLENLTVAVGNMRTIEQQDAFERFEEDVSKEVADLEILFDRALSELAGADSGS